MLSKYMYRLGGKCLFFPLHPNGRANFNKKTHNNKKWVNAYMMSISIKLRFKEHMVSEEIIFQLMLLFFVFILFAFWFPLQQ